MIKVLVCADSAADLARLEALVQSAPSLQFAGSSIGRTGLSQQIADTQPDILLERVAQKEQPEDPPVHDPDARAVPRVLLVEVREFPGALSAIRSNDSDIRAILPFWASKQEIVTAIEAAAAGLIVCHPDLIDHTAMTAEEVVREPTAARGQQLTPRESEILNLLAAGLGNKEIAWQLGISDHTVKYHVASIFNKLGASTRAEAVAIGIRQGLIAL